jgi:hypothetical protein
MLRWGCVESKDELGAADFRLRHRQMRRRGLKLSNPQFGWLFQCSIAVLDGVIISVTSTISSLS